MLQWIAWWLRPEMSCGSPSPPPPVLFSKLPFSPVSFGWFRKGLAARRARGSADLSLGESGAAEREMLTAERGKVQIRRFSTKFYALLRCCVVALSVAHSTCARWC